MDAAASTASATRTVRVVSRPLRLPGIDPTSSPLGRYSSAGWRTLEELRYAAAIDDEIMRIDEAALIARQE
jgi:hypothetical protein